MFIGDLHLLNLIAPVALTMLAKLGSNYGKTDLSLLDISSSDFDEDVSGIKRNLSLLRVDDRGK